MDSEEVTVADGDPEDVREVVECKSVVFFVRSPGSPGPSRRGKDVQEEIWPEEDLLLQVAAEVDREERT